MTTRKVTKYFFSEEEAMEGADPETRMMYHANDLGLEGKRIVAIKEEADHLAKGSTYIVYYEEVNKGAVPA